MYEFPCMNFHVGFFDMLFFIDEENMFSKFNSYMDVSPPEGVKYDINDYVYIKFCLITTKPGKYKNYDDLITLIVAHTDERKLVEDDNTILIMKINKHYWFGNYMGHIVSKFNDEKNTELAPEVKLIMNAETALPYYYLSNTRNHPIHAQQICKRIVDERFGDDYICKDVVLRVNDNDKRPQGFVVFNMGK